MTGHEAVSFRRTGLDQLIFVATQILALLSSRLFSSECVELW